MDRKVGNLITRIHASDNFKGSLVVTGCGSMSIAWLFSIPGSSNTLLSAYVPYSKKSLELYLEKDLTNHVSEKEALSIANAAYENTLKFINTSEKDVEIFRLGCTGAIATNRNRKGEDRAHIAIKSKNKECIYSVYFNKLKRDRISEEIIVSKQIINAIAYISEIPVSISLIVSIWIFDSGSNDLYNCFKA